MVGTQHDPGLMVLCLHTIFDLIKRDKSSDEFEVTCSYLEVYNEVGNRSLPRNLFPPHSIFNYFFVIYPIEFSISNVFRLSMIS